MMTLSQLIAAVERAEGADRHDVPMLLSSGTDEDCGCPTEQWLLHGIELDIHFEPDGSLEVLADAGDWDHSFALAAASMEDAREEAFTWVRNLPTEEEAALRAHESRAAMEGR